MTRHEEETILQKKSYWLGVLTIVITVLVGLLSSADIVGAKLNALEDLQSRTTNVETKQEQIDTRVTVLERDFVQNVTEISTNLKLFMQSKGVPYQEGRK